MTDDDFVEKTLVFLNKLDLEFFQNFFVYDEIDSTNIKAKELLNENLENGAIVIAKTQKSGRGRFNRVWESPDGGLYVSFILKPDIDVEKTTLLPLLTSIVVSKTLSYYGLSSKIKWPNDVVVNKKKIAGILLESDVYKDKLRYLILGIGINLNVRGDLFSNELKNIPTSVVSELKKPVDYYDFLKKLIIELEKYYSIFNDKEYFRIVSEWKKLSDTLNRLIKIKSSSGEIIGKAYDIDDSGFLIIITDSGEYKKIMSGDCFYFY